MLSVLLFPFREPAPFLVKGGGLGAGKAQADEKKSVENPRVLLFLGTGRPTVPPVRITVVDQFPVRALYSQVGEKVVESSFNMFARTAPSILRFSI